MMLWTTAELVRVLAELSDAPLAELCDRVLERMFLPDAEDDVALLAVRLQPASRAGERLVGLPGAGTVVGGG